MKVEYPHADTKKLFAYGDLRARFDQGGKILTLEMATNQHSEYVSISSLRQTSAESPEIKQSPSISKNGGKRTQQRQKQLAQAGQDQTPQVPIPEPMVTENGTTTAVWQFLEVSVHNIPIFVDLKY